MMVDVVVGGSARYELRRAILVYEITSLMRDELRDTFATVHPVLWKDRRSAPRLGAGTLCTMAFLQELASGLGSNLRPEVLPPNVIARTPHLIAWWTPAHSRPLFFREGSKLARVSGKHFPLPALVWKVIGCELYVRALREEARPKADTQLYRAPFWNTSRTGLVCQGTMSRPERVTVDTIEQWVDGFFGAQFTHVFDHFGGQGATKMKGGVEGLWRSLAGTRTRTKPFPVKTLVPAKETLQQFLERGGDAQD